MLSPVVLPIPAALATVALFIVAGMINRALGRVPDPWAGQPWADKRTGGRHRLADATDPYRPTRPPIVEAARWTPDDLDSALDAAERVAAEMAETERSWGIGDTRELVAA